MPIASDVLFGYVITSLPMAPPPHVGDDGAVESLITLSDCLGRFVPLVASFGWASELGSKRQGERDALLAAFGLGSDDADRVAALGWSLENRGLLTRPAILGSLAAVGEVLAVLPPSPGTQVMADGIHPDDVEVLMAEPNLEPPSSRA